MNSCNCIGRLALDPVARYFESGSVVVDFTIAIDKGKDKQGNKLPPVWLPVKAWGKTGELIADGFKKGELIALSGELDMDQWVDTQTNQKRSKLFLNARRLTFTKSSGGTGEPAPAGHYDEF